MAISHDHKEEEPPQVTWEKTKGNLISRFVQYHYRDTPGYQRTEQQIQNEATLLPGVKFNRWFTLPAAILIQFCCGSFYCWSVFNIPIDMLIFGENRNLTPITFYLTVGFFGFSAAIMGPWLERSGPRKACLVGILLILSGNLITALALHLKLIWMVFLGYGVFAGFGYGLCYISPVSTIQKWFPDRRGLASGFATCGFGLGSIIIAKLLIPLMTTVGLPLTFVILGCGFFTIMTLSALVLRIPPNDFEVNGLNSKGQLVGLAVSGKQMAVPHPAPTNRTLIQSITSKDFGLMYIMLFSNAIYGLVVISRLSNMITEIFQRTPDEATTAVAINGGFNLIGRLAFSVLSDYVGRKNCFVVMITSQLIILGAFSTITTTQTYWAFLLTMWILTACYGAGFGVIPAFLTDIFGPSHIGPCHGIILTAWSVAGVGGGLIFTAVFKHILALGYKAPDPYPYNVNVWWIFCVVLIGWFLTIWVRPTPKDKLAWRVIRRTLCCKGRDETTKVNVELH